MYPPLILYREYFRGYFIYPAWRIFHLSSVEETSFILWEGYFIYSPGA